jgi:hypothetical protein
MKNTEKQRHIENLSKLAAEPITASRFAFLKQLESRGNKYAVDYCNGDIQSAEEFERKIEPIKKAVVKIFPGLKKALIFNGDPRGYFLKINDEYMRAHDLRLTRDWGGYGILAPQFKKGGR